MLGLGKLRQLWRIKSEASELYDLAEAAEADPRLYRTSSWWRQVLTTAAALVSLIPLATKERTTMQTWILKIGMFAGAAVSIAAELQKLPLPPKAMGVIGSVAAIAGIVSGFLHTAPGQATDQPAK